MTEAELTIFETDHWKVVLNVEDQTYLGRSVVVCKRAAASLSDLTEEEWSDFHQAVKIFELSAKRGLGVTMFNWTCMMNAAYQQAPPDAHVHWHVRPRYNHPVDFGGEHWIDENFGHHYERKTNREISDQVAKDIMAELKNPSRPWPDGIRRSD